MKLSLKPEGIAKRSWRAGMNTLEIDLDLLEPVEAVCTDQELIVTLSDGVKLTTPLWWYPRLLNATPAQRANVELSPMGVHWEEIDEDLSVEGMLRGAKARGARMPQVAAE
jgi:hypothetical protein